MNEYSYFYNNTLKSPNLKQDNLLKGEHILFKSEDIKCEDSDKNIERKMCFYITNYRCLIINESKVFDIPHSAVSSHAVHCPYFGSKYICIYLSSSIQVIPNYIKEYLTISKKVTYPKYVMIKFKDSSVDLKKPDDLITYAIKNNDFNDIPTKLKNEEEKKKIMQSQVPTENTKEESYSGIGIQRVVNMIDNKNKENSTLISSSFSDINSLKANVSKLIELGAQLRAKVDVKSNDKNEEKEEISQILQKIGYIDPVTKEIAGKAYIKELSVQLESFFYDYFKVNEGIISIVDAYCVYNRARGMSTISPADMKKAIDVLHDSSSRIYVKYFESMIMIHSKEYSIDVLYENSIKPKVKENELCSFSLNDLSGIFKLKSLSLGKLLIDELVNKGFLCVDESDFEIRYYNNLIKLY